MTKFPKQNKIDIDAGAMIRSYLDNHGIKVSWLAKQIYTDRCNCYKILKRKNIDLYLLILISQKLEHNFLEDISKAYENYFTLHNLNQQLRWILINLSFLSNYFADFLILKKIIYNIWIFQSSITNQKKSTSAEQSSLSTINLVMLKSSWRNKKRQYYF